MADCRQCRWTHLLLVLVLMPGLLFAAQATDEAINPHQVREKEHQLAALRARIGSIRDAIRNDEIARDTLVAELRAAEIRIGEISEKMRVSQQALDELQLRLREAVAERDRAAAALSQERTALQAQIRAAYVLGRQQRLKLLLRQGEPERVGRALVYYDYLHAARNRRVMTYTERLETLRTLEAEIAGHWREIETLQSAQAQELEAQQAAFSERQDVLAALHQRLQSQQGSLQSLEQDEASLENLVKELQTALRDLERARNKEPFVARRGKLDWPVNGSVESGHGAWGAERGAESQGLTLVAAIGTEIRAVHGGQVVFADWLKGFGLLLIIDHGNDYLSIYAHNESLYRRVGDWVSPGEVVATVGNSGGQTRAALYFEIRHRGSALDPRPWFAGKPQGNPSHDS